MLHFKHPNILHTSEVYHPRDIRDEKVNLALAHWEHGEIKTPVPSKIRWIHGKSAESKEARITLTKLRRRIRRKCQCSQCARAEVTFNLRCLGVDRLQKKIRP